MEFRPWSPKQGAWLSLIATASSRGGLACWAGVPHNCLPMGEKSILQYGTLVTNSGFAGLPVVSGAYGDEGPPLGLPVHHPHLHPHVERRISHLPRPTPSRLSEGAAQTRHHRRGGGAGMDALPAPLPHLWTPP